ncbi:MAG: hypothetical protein B6I38_09880 [Anaerolineaceae bacterium 4572_5.1]|nr:MAG: hypothetical protein B6I38_09880 [Anaerolineaceae bacterium 4572_5.1]
MTESERRQEPRKNFSYYMRLIDTATQEVIGHLSDISTGGFKLDSENPIPLEKEYQFNMALTSEIANKSYMVFKARSKWCQTDPLDPFIYNVGFHITDMNPIDLEIFNRMVRAYGTKSSSNFINPNASTQW